MKKITFLKTVLTAVCMLVGSGSAWAQTTTVGEEDNTTGWWSAFSDYYTVEPNRTLRLSFTNYSDKSGNAYNWIAAVTTDFDRAAEQSAEAYWEYLILRADNFGWGGSFEAGTLTSNYNWDTFTEDMDDSHVEMTVTRSGSTVTLRADITTSTGTQYYEQWVGTCGDGTQNIRVFLTTEKGHLTDIAKISADESIYHVYQNYEDATDATSWTSPNGVLNLVTGDATYGKYITLTQSGGGQRSGSTTFDNTSFSTLSSYTLEFDYRFSKQSDRQNQIVAYSNTFSSPGNNTYYTNNDALINLQQTEAKAATWKIDNNADDLVELEAGKWYHFNISVDVTNQKVTTTIANGETIVLNAHEASKPNINLIFKGIWAVVGRQGTVASFDNFKVVGTGTEILTTSVSTESVSASTATLSVSTETNAVSSTIKQYYSTSYKLTDPVEIADGSVELASGVYYFYSVNTLTGSMSNSVQYEVNTSETVYAPTVTVSGSTVTVTSGESNAGSNVSSYAVKYATSEDPATEGIALNEGDNTLEQGYYYVYTVSEYGNISEPTYAEVVCRNTETYNFKYLLDNGYTTINNSGDGTKGKVITTFTNSSSEVGRYINGRLEFLYQSSNGNNWWMRDSSRPFFVSANKSSNFAVKVSADDAVVFNGSTLTFIENNNVYGVSAGDAVTSGKVYFAKENGYVLINGGAYAVINSVVVYTNDEIFSTIATSSETVEGNRVFTVTPAYSTNESTVNTYYTTDGTQPTSSSTLLEGSEITIMNDCSLKIASVNTVTGKSSNVYAEYVLFDEPTTTYDFSSAALTEAYGGTTISFDNTESALATISKLDYYQLYCGDGENQNVIDNLAISKNGQLGYYSDKYGSGLLNSGGGYRSLAILNVKAGQRIVFKTTNATENAEISVISNATALLSDASTGTWVFSVDANGTVAFNSHRYSYINTIDIYDPVKELKTISVAGYATLYTDRALDFSTTGLTAYIAKAGKTKDIEFEPVTTIPANTGVLLKGDAGNYRIPVLDSSDTDTESNLFEGVLEATVKDAGILVLMATPELGFYRTTSAFTVGANTAYLPASVASGRSFIWFEESGTTAIQAPVVKNLNAGEIYTIAGQRVAKPTKGLYIMNGKKVVVK